LIRLKEKKPRYCEDKNTANANYKQVFLGKPAATSITNQIATKIREEPKSGWKRTNKTR
jgi:hypothetical protein